MFIKHFIVLDTETTGLGNLDEIIELGIIDNNGNTLYESTFNTNNIITEEAQKVNHITYEELSSSPLFCDEWEKIKNIIGNNIVVGHNISFDQRLLSQTLYKYHLEDFKFRKTIDTYTMAKKKLKNGRLNMNIKSYSLNNLAKLFDLKEEEHRAVSDCLLTLELLNKLLKY